MTDRDEHDSAGEKLLGADYDLDAWEPLDPPTGFAERVLDRVRTEQQAIVPAAAPTPTRAVATRPRWTRWLLVAAALGVVGAGSTVTFLRPAQPTAGESAPATRTEVAVGGRALAVVEPGASIRWNGNDVVQSKGDVFYRVERGGRFTVHTPGGDVEVTGTCFTVKVRPLTEAARDAGDHEMKSFGKTAVTGVVASAVTALAFVAVYEGGVRVSHAADRVELKAGEGAQTGPNGVRKVGEREFEANVAVAQSDDPRDTANRNLVSQIGEYRARLEAITVQKKELETQLKRSEETLAEVTGGPGGASGKKNEFDLDANDLKELAKSGAVKYITPCMDSDPTKVEPPTPKQLQDLGLSPDDGATIQSAIVRTGDRVWSEIKGVCAAELSDPKIVAKLDMEACRQIVMELERAKDPEATSEAQRRASEIRAGLRPMPAAGEPVHPVTRLMLSMSLASKTYEDELAKSFGPQEAHRIVYSGKLCEGRHSYGGPGPRK